MQEQGWLLDQIKEIEKLAEEMGHEGVVLGLEHALIVCAEEADRQKDNVQHDRSVPIQKTFDANENSAH